MIFTKSITRIDRMNPLDVPNNPVKFEGRNITAMARTSKDGPRYRISLECDKGVFDAVITGRLEGAAFAISMCRVDYDTPELAVLAGDNQHGIATNLDMKAGVAAEVESRRKIKSPHGPLELRAYELCRDAVFWDYLYHDCDVAMHGLSEKLAADYIKKYCGVSHRNEIDKSRDAAVAFGRLVSDFEIWKGINK